MAKITLDNGMVIEGSVEEIKAMAEAFGVKEAEEMKAAEPTYRKIDAYGVGNFVKFIDEGDLPSYIKADKYYEIIEIDDGDAVIIDEDDEEFDTCGYVVSYFEKVTEAPAESAEPEPLKVGDYAKVLIDDLDGKDAVVRISRVDEDDFDYRPYLSTTGYWYKTEDIVKATEEEIAGAKRQQAEAKETERWAKIGREVNEFKAGDIVRVNLISESAISSHLKRGEMGEVGEISDDGFRVNGRLSSVNWVEPLDVELITPVEARFDRA